MRSESLKEGGNFKVSLPRKVVAMCGAAVGLSLLASCSDTGNSRTLVTEKLVLPSSTSEAPTTTEAVTTTTEAPTTTTEAPTTTTEAPTTTTTVDPNRCLTGPNMEGCFTYDQADQIAEYSARYVNKAVQAFFPTIPISVGIVYVKSGETVRTPCGTFDSTADSWCFNDNSIVWGQDTIWDLYNRVGDAAPVLDFARLMGRGIQRAVKIPKPVGEAKKIAQEKQADCVAGVLLSQVQLSGNITDQDTSNVRSMFELMASAPGTQNANAAKVWGTADERTDAFNTGFKSSTMFFCNDQEHGLIIGNS